MKDNEIAQALRYCGDPDYIGCTACKYFCYGDCLKRLVADAADLTERLTAENASLREKVYSMSGEWCAMMSVLNSIGSYDRLRELAAADKDGRVVVLPCKVGDTIYFAYVHPILRYTVTGYEMGNAGISRVRCKHVDKETGLTFNFTFRPSSIGKTVFLSREEAEKALQEMEGKKDG